MDLRECRGNLCKDKRQEGGVYVLCSDMIDFKVRDGDSGAPVFLYNSSDGTAELRGVVWGRRCRET